MLQKKKITVLRPRSLPRPFQNPPIRPHGQPCAITQLKFPPQAPTSLFILAIGATHHSQLGNSPAANCSRNLIPIYRFDVLSLINFYVCDICHNFRKSRRSAACNNVAALQTAVRGGHRAGVASVSVAEPSGFRVVLCLCAERIDEGHGLPLSRLGAKMPAAHAQWIGYRICRRAPTELGARGTAARLVCLFYR
jgi:hypothetical protein